MEKSKRSQAAIGLVIVLVMFLAVGGLIYYVYYKQIQIQCVKDANGKCEEFCGSSTSALCSLDSDCKVGGCSSQVCQGKNEESIITTCEYKECYDAEKFGLKCECVEGKCGWK